MIKFPKQIAACSFVWGDRSFLATSIISWVSTVSRISTCPVKMKFLIAAVPCNNKNISSLFLTKFINLGKTAIILANASLCVNLLVFFSLFLLVFFQFQSQIFNETRGTLSDLWSRENPFIFQYILKHNLQI